MDDGHDDGHDDGAESIGSRVTLWLILHAFILSKSVLASETLRLKFEHPGGCPPFWTKSYGEPRRAILLAKSVWPAAFVCRAIGRR
jgi:hypothetical protein